jgi:hypothetical protein
MTSSNICTAPDADDGELGFVDVRLG